MQRRRLLAATGTVVTALIAGCGSPDAEGEDGGGGGAGTGGTGGGTGGTGGTGGGTGGTGGGDRAEPDQFGPRDA
ncbi:hypothetical protein [Halobacterium wangiae]|uniref:hypothetical protein n=1 Tax=Halobacterium wangiae TaxID=2902623 RepID=UPI001E3C0F41|nr:hypothetical protein [Halobacterium wangiae]